MSTQLTYPDTIELGSGSFAMLAPAKINLYLRVIRKRPDGYHDLDTLFQEIDWCDRIEFSPSREWSLEIHGGNLSAGASNLMTRAALALSKASGLPMRGCLQLHKSLPIGGGLGGGSSDGAITLIGLNRLWRLDWPLEQLHEIAADLGSDCPFFLYGGLARGRGRGERLEMKEGCQGGVILLVVPPFGIGTSWVFDKGVFPLTGDEKNAILKFCPVSVSENHGGSANFHNDLENIVLSEYSELRKIYTMLQGLGAEAVSVSGSGSTIFAIFGERSRAMHAAQQFGKPFETRICQAISRQRVN